MIGSITMDQIIIGILSFIIGAIFGWIARGIADKQRIDNAAFVLIVVTSTWAASMFVDIINPEYSTSPIVHGLMGAIVGFFYKPSFAGKLGGSDDNGN